MNALPGTFPVLSCDEARTLESALFAGEESREWAAMQRAGQAIATELMRDAQEIGGLRANARILVLVGKGHNGGDALIAAATILRRFPAARAVVVFVFGERTLRPLASRAWRELLHAHPSRVSQLAASALIQTERTELSLGAPGSSPAFSPSTDAWSFALCLDGVFGFQFHPPADRRVTELLTAVNALPIRLRVAVDLPSAGLFRADFTYATGSVKAPVVVAQEAGRVRFLNLGFFRGDEPGADRVLTADVLAALGGLRSPQSDKRSFGHVFVVGGSRDFPGAIMMTVMAALRSGAGLVTAFVPESLVAAYAAHAPEAMWVGCPETPTGGLALEGEHLWRARCGRAAALVIGPGLGRQPETLALVRSIVGSSKVPVVIDADALQPDVVNAGNVRKILTPHAGEFSRISGGLDLREFAAKAGATVVLKGVVTRIAGRAGSEPPSPENGSSGTDQAATVYHSFFGGPVLARGGSGDLLAGLIGGLLAQKPDEPLLAAARGVVWHGLSADLLARAFGQTPVRVTQLLDFLPRALRASCVDAENASAHEP
jgi:ADP-dependent NAD(P)H-hydrate dehydratase / NAD(P)H-hydrate epimerase